MRALIIAGVIIVVLVLVGWLRFSSPEGDPTIRVDTDRVKQDTSNIVEKAKDAASEVERRADYDPEL
ncbi:hypothetical protein SAMN06265222_106178 [Neorhodopirellula lusitana]|uniref:Uncharacterized protein n=1 Tax=Neorhodopirellula lusitana TaxID=445327 RepID=A0ABY1Q498_9BACT|nr:hypothetical protein [Neorhodopirellula lusitana]SMP59175.1 hypothetical protein SAMN06265222_106178 [Neorhodopirellula lusitana]